MSWQKDVIGLSCRAIIPSWPVPLWPSAICQTLKYPGSSGSQSAVALCDSLWNVATSSQVWLDAYHCCVLLLADEVTFHAISPGCHHRLGSNGGTFQQPEKFSHLSTCSFIATFSSSLGFLPPSLVHTHLFLISATTSLSFSWLNNNSTFSCKEQSE